MKQSLRCSVATVLTVLFSQGALSFPGESAAPADPQIRGVTFENFHAAENLVLEPPGAIFDYRDTLDPLLVETYGGKELRNSIFSYRKAVLTEPEWEDFLAWYYAHFGFDPNSQTDFDRFVKAHRVLWEHSLSEIDADVMEKAYNHLYPEDEVIYRPRQDDEAKLPVQLNAYLKDLATSLAATTEFAYKLTLLIGFERSFEEIAPYQNGNTIFKRWLLAKAVREHLQRFRAARQDRIEDGMLLSLQPAYFREDGIESRSRFKDAGPAEYAHLLTLEDNDVTVNTKLEPGKNAANYFLIAAKGMRFKFKLRHLPVGSRLLVRHVSDSSGEAKTASADLLEATYTAPRPGEIKIRIELPERPAAEQAKRGFALNITCNGHRCKKVGTRYPVVFLHGMAGKREYVGMIDYWQGLDRALGEHGLGLDVFYTEASFIGHSFTRAPQLYKQLQVVLQTTGAEKVHLIGHSQGGLDARTLAGGFDLAHRIASITTFGTPHGGTGVNSAVPWWTGMDFRLDYMQTFFNRHFPLIRQIPVLSYGGIACPPFDSDCRKKAGGAKISELFWPFMLATRDAHSSDEFQGANDGCVPLKSAHWGKYQGTVFGDHLHLIWGDDYFDRVELYKQQALQLTRIEEKSFR